MKLVVIGGAGLIGSKVTAILHHGGHEVIAASRRTGVNLVTGEGISEALTGAEVVIDVTNPPAEDRLEALKFFETGSRNLLEAEKKASIRQHVALSIVGVDRVPDQAYYHAKVVQERMIEASGMPYSIIRSTQFLEFLGTIADAMTDGNIVRVPPALLQPIAAHDAAVFLAEASLAKPLNGIIEVAGPHRAPFSEIIGCYLKVMNDPRKVVVDPLARYFGGRLEEQSLVPAGFWRSQLH